MTDKQIKEAFNLKFNHGKDRVVDISKDTYGDRVLVTIITITKSHTVWEHTCTIENGELQHLRHRCLQ